MLPGKIFAVLTKNALLLRTKLVTSLIGKLEFELITFMYIVICQLLLLEIIQSQLLSQ